LKRDGDSTILFDPAFENISIVMETVHAQRIKGQAPRRMRAVPELDGRLFIVYGDAPHFGNGRSSKREWFLSACHYPYSYHEIPNMENITPAQIAELKRLYPTAFPLRDQEYDSILRKFDSNAVDVQGNCVFDPEFKASVYNLIQYAFQQKDTV
jgi:hypothetical protein